MNDVQTFIQNFSGSTEQSKDINDYLSKKFEIISDNVSVPSVYLYLARMES